MSSNLQAKYLRVLQDSQVRRVGGHDEIGVDVRVVAATNKDVVKAVQEGTFREDLYYRVNVLTIPLPPLRRRPEDIALLADAFIAEFNEKYGRQVRSVDGASLKLLNDHTWPGNVRELDHSVERGVLMGRGEWVRVQDLGLQTTTASAPPRLEDLPLEDVEKVLIQKALARYGTVSQAAQALGLSRSALYRRLEKHGL